MKRVDRRSLDISRLKVIRWNPHNMHSLHNSISGKNTYWYQLDGEARRTMMIEHMRIGKRYADVGQILVYSFGVQDQEFVLVYEMEDLSTFSRLVHELRHTEARRFTQRDTPLHTAIHHPAEETLALF